MESPIAVVEGEDRPDRDWHLRHFRDPQSVSPGSIMPKFPLTDKDITDLSSYMLSLKSQTTKGAGT